MPLLLPLLHGLLKLSWLCAGLTVSVIWTYWSVLLCGYVAFGLWNRPLAVIPVLTGAVITLLLYFTPIYLLPEDHGQLPAMKADTLGRRFMAFLQKALALLLAMAVWGIYFLWRESAFPRIDTLILWVSFLGCFIAILFLIRGYALHFMDQAAELMDQQYQAELLNFMQVIRSQRHDFNFHLQAIAGLIDRRQYKECQNYLQSIVKNASATNDLLQVRSPALGAMLSTFQEIAFQKKIRLTFDIYNDLEHVPCTAYELNTIIGNLIQNALDEVELHHSDEPWVQVIFLKRGGNNVIRVTNPFSGPAESLEQVLSPGYSTKKAHEGIGLTTVQRILARYNGLVYPEFQEGKVSFIVQFPIEEQI